MTPKHRAWTDGVIQGLRQFAWWNDGVQYVGLPGTVWCKTLSEAIKTAEGVWADEMDGPVPRELLPCKLCGPPTLTESHRAPVCDSCYEKLKKDKANMGKCKDCGVAVKRLHWGVPLCIRCLLNRELGGP